jgi:hemerythrin-like domain-containing protein
MMPPIPDIGARAGLAAALPDNPLEGLTNEHMHLREVCAHLDALAGSSRAQPVLALAARAFIRGVLPAHARDEDEDLFPLLRRCAPDDRDLHGTLDRLSRDHREIATTRPGVIAILERIITDNAAPTPAEAAWLTAFADLERRHLLVENAVILPLARGYLKARDLKRLRQRMQARRSADPGE